MLDRIAGLIVDVPDLPQPGVVFKDITPLLADHAAFEATIQALAEPARSGADVVVDKVVGIEARGFILAAPVALALGAGFVPVRKAGKLPREVHAASYSLEYGEATIEIHADALAPGDRVLVVDDVLATGGTVAAASTLIAQSGATVDRRERADRAELPQRAQQDRRPDDHPDRHNLTRPSAATEAPRFQGSLALSVDWVPSPSKESPVADERAAPAVTEEAAEAPQPGGAPTGAPSASAPARVRARLARLTANRGPANPVLEPLYRSSAPPTPRPTSASSSGPTRWRPRRTPASSARAATPTSRTRSPWPRSSPSSA